jgi:hypothetical protein
MVVLSCLRFLKNPAAEHSFLLPSRTSPSALSALSVGFLQLQPPLYSLDISALSIFLCRTPAAVPLPPARRCYPLRRFGLQKSWLSVFISSRRRP